MAFANSHKVAISTAKQFRPDIILSFGEDATRNSIHVETQAYNQQQATIPDNDGFQPKGKAIIPGGIPTIATNFPIWPKAVVANLRQTPWPMVFIFKARKEKEVNIKMSTSRKAIKVILSLFLAFFCLFTGDRVLAAKIGRASCRERV